jgi:hypothetical protein
MADEFKTEEFEPAFFWTLWEAIGGIGSWEVLAQTQTNAPGTEAEELDHARGILKRVLDEGWMEATWGADLDRRLTPHELDELLEGNDWAVVPPPGNPAVFLMPTDKWLTWRMAEEAKLPPR